MATETEQKTKQARLRWYTTVVDCHNAIAQAKWWADVLGWQSIYETDDECVIIPADYDMKIPSAEDWRKVGPGLVFVPVPEGKTVKNRLHIDLAPHVSDDRDAQIQELLQAGASRVDVGQPADAGFTVLADPEGNEFCVLGSRDR